MEWCFYILYLLLSNVSHLLKFKYLLLIRKVYLYYILIFKLKFKKITNFCAILFYFVIGNCYIFILWVICILYIQPNARTRFQFFRINVHLILFNLISKNIILIVFGGCIYHSTVIGAFEWHNVSLQCTYVHSYYIIFLIME